MYVGRHALGAPPPASQVSNGVYFKNAQIDRPGLVVVVESPATDGDARPWWKDAAVSGAATFVSLAVVGVLGLLWARYTKLPTPSAPGLPRL